MGATRNITNIHIVSTKKIADILHFGNIFYSPSSKKHLLLYGESWFEENKDNYTFHIILKDSLDPFIYVSIVILLYFNSPVGTLLHVFFVLVTITNLEKKKFQK